MSYSSIVNSLIIATNWLSIMTIISIGLIPPQPKIKQQKRSALHWSSAPIWLIFLPEHHQWANPHAKIVLLLVIYLFSVNFPSPCSGDSLRNNILDLATMKHDGKFFHNLVKDFNSEKHLLVQLDQLWAKGFIWIKK